MHGSYQELYFRVRSRILKIFGWPLQISRCFVVMEDVSCVSKRQRGSGIRFWINS